MFHGLEVRTEMQPGRLGSSLTHQSARFGFGRALDWGMKPGKTNVATFSDLEKAEHVRDCLQEAGIAAEVADESKLQRLWFLSKPLAGEKVYVREEDFARAMETLKVADEQDHILQGEVRCPQCDSAKIDYPQFTRKFMTTTLVEVLCLLHMLDKQFYCEGCHHTWPVDVKLRQSTDVLNWPDKGDGRMVRKETH